VIRFYLPILIAVLAAAMLLCWRFPGKVLAAGLVIMRTLCGLQRRTTIIDGQTWSYLDSGGEQVPAVLLHGFGADKYAWLAYGRLLRRRFRVIAPDLPGFGESPRDPALDYSVAAQCRRLHRFMTELGLSKVHLAGNSLGGFIAAWFALTYPEALHSLMLIDAAGVAGSRKSEADLTIEQGHNPFAVTDLRGFELMLSTIAHKPPRIPGFIVKALYQDLQDRQAFLERLFWGLLNDLRARSLLDHLPGLKVALLVLWGREDRLVDVSAAVAVHERVPGSTLVILNEVGHVPMIEAPRLTAMHHLRFVDSLGRAGQPSAA
jgi:pimeloyl-ACP methyl ester carboxylesterase